MKLSVITLHTVNNYGSALQTYATQTVLEDLGCDVEFVDYYRKDNTGEAAVEKAMHSAAMQRYKNIWDKNDFTRWLVKIPLRMMLKRKLAPMQNFIKERIHLTPKAYYSFEEILQDVPQADVYITGSDQVWNSIWNKGIEKAFFLEYAPEGKKRVAFSASIGRESLDEYEIAPTREMLQKYAYISMREQSGVDLLRDMGIDSTLILDPTLMLNAESWRKLAIRNQETEPYLLIYQLNTNKQMDQYAVELAKRNQWKIIRVSYGYSGKQQAGKCLVCPKVEVLLGYFDRAACVLTDSFHATAFSLNLSTPFISILPERFGTRINNILQLTGTKHRRLDSYQDFEIVNRAIDFNQVQNILDGKRQAGLKFLKKAILNEES